MRSAPGSRSKSCLSDRDVMSARMCPAEPELWGSGLVGSCTVRGTSIRLSTIPRTGSCNGMVSV